MGLQVEIRKELSGFTLEVAFRSENGVLGLLGGSGSGKSMTLKCIAGLLRPDEGHIELDGKVLFDSASRICLAPQRRNTGYLFQNYALFPNMTVARNILCGYKGEEGQRELQRMLERFQLSGMEARYPHQLSGGQQQRVALARMMISRPQVLMLDEPFSALDAYLREEMQLEVSRMLEEYQGITLLVSHDRDEIYRLSDRIAVYDGGRIVRIGNKQEVFLHPQTWSAAIMTGCKNVFPAYACGEAAVTIPDWGTTLHTSEKVDASVAAVGVRAHYFEVVEREGENTLVCTIQSVVEGPFETIVYLFPVGGKQRICWKTDKQTFAGYKKCSCFILHVPRQAVLPLYDEKRSNDVKMCYCLHDTE